MGTPYSTQGDSWSLGLTLVELAFGYYPFGNQGGATEDRVPLTVFELLQHITKDPVPTIPRPNEPGGGKFSNEFADFIRDTLVRNPKKRQTPATLLRTPHPFIPYAEKQNVDMKAWCQSFLEPNLDAKQMQRWSTTQKIKRQSIQGLEKRSSSVTAGLAKLSVTPSENASHLQSIVASPIEPRNGNY